MIEVDRVLSLCFVNSRTSRALIVGIGGGYLKSNGAETDGKKKCCVDTDLCQLFFMKQTSDNCQKYVSPFIGIFVTTNGVSFAVSHKSLLENVICFSTKVRTTCLV